MQFVYSNDSIFALNGADVGFTSLQGLSDAGCGSTVTSLVVVHLHLLTQYHWRYSQGLLIAGLAGGS